MANVLLTECKEEIEVRGLKNDSLIISGQTKGAFLYLLDNGSLGYVAVTLSRNYGG